MMRPPPVSQVTSVILTPSSISSQPKKTLRKIWSHRTFFSYDASLSLMGLVYRAVQASLGYTRMDASADCREARPWHDPGASPK
ncbi:hypothetical protein DENSPDRAFT_499251 [Dentipellis sp. KUC8613]|nr:hypothetical protein DENSPDRAFT_499251 [Dentipellis sp. KUC8613]